MKKIIVGFLALAVTVFLSGCSFNHPVAKDYGPYLQKSAAVDLPKTSLKSAYVLDSKTQNHRYEFRAATVGYAHLWIVEFGQILDQTLNAKYVQSAFGDLHKKSTQDSAGNLISFSLEKYEFKDYRAYVTMKVTLSNDGKTILEKSYNSEGNSQGGQMWTAGPFGMKNATLESTKFAIDAILKKFIADIPKN
jgi:hypothetical protein